MNYKILVLDIDGTVTNQKKEITKRTKEAIFRLADKGVKLVIASGRPTYGILPVAHELELEKRGGYILSYNGGKILNCQTNEVIYEKTLPLHTISKIAELAKKHDCNLMSYDGDCVITTNPNDSYIELEARINHLPVRKITSFSDYDNQKMNKCIATADGEKLALVEPIFAKAFPDLNVFRSEPFFLEIVPKGIDKAQSLNVLLTHLGLTREDMVAMGDGFNDLSMIQFAKMGVAMANAQPIVRDHADFVTKSNEEDGVAYAIDCLFTD